ncbi:ABC transporter [Oscillatoriales cyanobacterium USR001]|nr:ABC transporter [Oscillatoriales cyanobacterium USR001]
MAEIAICTKNLTRDFGKIRALDNLSLAVPRGVVFGFLGPNGSGKTTTIRLLLGLLEATTGSAEVLGYDTRSHAQEIRQQTGALLEHPGLYERLNAEDNLEFYARAWRLSPAKRRSRIEELLKNLGLWERRRETVRNWSRGMKQKLAVARAMLHSPPLIFLDEPTNGLDPVAAAALREDLQELVAREGVTVFLTTHNLVEAEKLCSYAGVIRQGKLLAAGSLDELRSQVGSQRLEIVGRGFSEKVLKWAESQPEVSSVQLEGEHLTIVLRKRIQVPKLVKLLVNAGAEIEEVRKHSTNLEEIFLTLME